MGHQMVFGYIVSKVLEAGILEVVKFQMLFLDCVVGTADHSGIITVY